MPRAAWKRQPSGRVELSHSWRSSVLSASLGGRFYDSASHRFQESGIGATVNEFGVADNPDGVNGVTELAAGGTAFLILAVFVPVELSGVKQICSYHSSSTVLEFIFQFRTNGGNFDFIRFNTARSVFVQSTAVPADLASVCAWSNGVNYGLVTRNASVQGVITGTPATWASSDLYCNWYRRRSGNTYSEFSKHQGLLRAVLRDTGDSAARQELVRNPWQLFAPAPSRFYLIPSAGVAVPSLSSPFFTNRIPRVTLTY